MAARQTIQGEIVLSGMGVHSGKSVRLLLRPLQGREIIFRRVDLSRSEARLDPRRVESRNCTTLLGETFVVRTMEHLLASFFALGINSIVVELDADEIPILDGSALPFVQAIEKAGIRRLTGSVPSIKILEPVLLEEKGASVSAFPSPTGEGLELAYSIDFSHPVIGTQSLSFAARPGEFVREIAPARTFGFLKDVETLRRQGLALGGSFDNTIVLDDEKVVNGPLRFPDEFVRHKLLDFMGDLSLLGRPLVGRFAGNKAGHRLHIRFVNFLLDHPEFWAEV